MAEKQSLIALVGRRCRLEKNGVVHEGVLVLADSQGQLTMFDVDDIDNPSTGLRFSENDGWTVTEIFDPGAQATHMTPA